METKHTPGPWSIKIDHSENADWAHKWPQIIGGDGYVVVGTEGIYGDYQTDMKNAKLIAAAPDLLEALQDMGVRYGLTEQARAAIKKATE